MKSIYDFDDIHSHGYPANDSKIVNLDYDEEVCDKGYYSIGIHPWRTADQNFDAATAIESVRQKAVKANVIAIGECGIDKLRGANIDLQKDIFESQVEISEALKKPLIIHAVKSLNEIIELRDRLKPNQLWIIHGFRGKKQMAEQLIRKGIAISVGEHFNSEVIKSVPDDMLFYESDESELPINEIINRAKSFRAGSK